MDSEDSDSGVEVLHENIVKWGPKKKEPIVIATIQIDDDDDDVPSSPRHHRLLARETRRWPRWKHHWGIRRNRNEINLIDRTKRRVDNMRRRWKGRVYSPVKAYSPGRGDTQEAEDGEETNEGEETTQEDEEEMIEEQEGEEEMVEEEEGEEEMVEEAEGEIIEEEEEVVVIEEEEMVEEAEGEVMDGSEVEGEEEISRPALLDYRDNNDSEDDEVTVVGVERKRKGRWGKTDADGNDEGVIYVDTVLATDTKRKTKKTARRSKKIQVEEEVSHTIDTGRSLARGQAVSTADRAFDSHKLMDDARKLYGSTADSHFSFDKMSRTRKEIALKRVEGTNLPPVGHPLGAAYDNLLNAWIYTDTDGGEVLVASYEGLVKDRLKGFTRPSAIAVITPGSHFAVLDYNGITLIDLMTNTRKPIANGFKGNYRGLATTNDGHLVTIFRVSYYKHVIQVFASSGLNKPIYWLAYEDGRTPPMPSNPSFLCTRREMIYVTDLMTNKLTVFAYSETFKKVDRVGSRDLSSSPRRTSELHTKFISGVVADSNNVLMMADARSHSINLASSAGSFIQKVPFLSGEAPYISGIAVAPTGRLMVCLRHERSVRLYDIVPLVTAMDELTDAMDGVQGVGHPHAKKPRV